MRFNTIKKLSCISALLVSINAYSFPGLENQFCDIELLKELRSVDRSEFGSISLQRAEPCEPVVKPPTTRPKPSSKTWDVYSKFYSSDKLDMQDIAWNSFDQQMYIFREHDDTKVLQMDEVYKGDPSRVNDTGTRLPGHQSFDILDNKIYHASGSGVGVWDLHARKGEKPKFVIGLQIDSNAVSLPQGLKFSGWTWSNTAVSDQYIVRSAYPNVTLSGHWEERNKKDRIHRHMFVYEHDKNGRKAKLKYTWQLQGIEQMMQGVEVTNNRVYAIFGGILKYKKDHLIKVQEYTLDGSLLREHRFNADKVISTGWQERNIPGYLKVEAEGLTVKDGKVLAGIRYDYGDVGRKYKSLIYQVFDSNYVNKNPRVETFNLVNSTQNMCLDVTGYTGGKKRNVQIYHCDGGPDQRWYFTTTSHVPVALKDTKPNQRYYIKNAKSNLCLDIEGYSGGKDKTAMMWDCQSQVDQHFYSSKKLTEDSYGITFRNAKKSLCLDVGGSSGKSGENVQLWSCSYNTDQKWSIENNYIQAVPVSD